MWIKNKRFHSGEDLQSLNGFQSFPWLHLFYQGVFLVLNYSRQIRLIWIKMCSIILYMIPLLFIYGAIMEWWLHRRRKKLYLQNSSKTVKLCLFSTWVILCFKLTGSCQVKWRFNDKTILSYKTRILTYSNRQTRKWNDDLFYISFSGLLLPKQTRVLVYRAYQANHWESNLHLAMPTYGRN